MFVFVCVFVRLLAFLRARWANIASSRANIARRWLHLAPQTDQHSPKTTQHSPKMGQHSPKMDQPSVTDGPTWRQHACETLRIHGFFHGFCVSSFFGPTSGQDWTTYVSDGPTYHQDGAAYCPDATQPPTWANMAPIPGPTLPQNGRRPWGEPGGEPSDELSVAWGSGCFGAFLFLFAFLFVF